jgi:hypothetical protein
MKGKIYRVNSEGALEEAVKMFIELAASKKKRKNIYFWFPNEQFSDMFLRAAYTDFSFKNIPPQPNMNINIYIEGSKEDDDLETEQDA